MAPAFYGAVHIDLGTRDMARLPGLLDAVKTRLDGTTTKAIEILSYRLETLRRLAAELEGQGFLSAGEVQIILDEATGSPLRAAAE